MPLLLTLCGLAAAVYIFAWWAGRAGPLATARVIRWAMWIVASIPLIILFRAGAIGSALTVLGMAVPSILVWKRLAKRGRPSAGTRSKVNTAFLEMELDHDSGEMRGRIISGSQSGQWLVDLNLSELLQLWQECQGDSQSAALLQAYLDRVHPEWQNQVDEPPVSSPGGPMTLEQARNILGVSENADADEIRAAHRRLMQGVHPDHGGSNYLAAQVNKAKDLLLDYVDS